MKKLILVASLGLLMSSPVFALVEKDYGWFGNASLGGVLTTGNTDTSSINASLRPTYRSKQWRHRFDVNVLDARDQGNNTAQRYVGNYRFTHRYLPGHDLFLDLRLVVDEFSGYDRQYFETIGYVYRAIEGLDDLLDVEIGVGLTQQQLDQGEREGTSVLRAGFDYLHEFDGGNRFSVDLLVLEGRDNTYSQLRANLKTHLVGNVGLEVGQTLQRNSTVAVDKKNTDTTTNVGLVYQF